MDDKPHKIKSNRRRVTFPTMIIELKRCELCGGGVVKTHYGYICLKCKLETYLLD